MVLKLDSVSINKSLAQEFVTQIPRIYFTGSKLDVKYVNTVKLRVKSNRMFGAKHSKTN